MTGPKILMENVSQNRDAWIASRANSLGSSDITTIAGLNAFQSPLELWAIKTGKIVRENKDNPAMLYGRMVEPAIRAVFAMVEPAFDITANDATFQHQDYDWAIATPDSYVTLRHDTESIDYDLCGSEKGLCELKHTGRAQGWDEGAPNYAHIQLMWQLGIMQMDWGFVAAIVGGRPNDARTPFFRFEKPIFDQLIGLGLAFQESVTKDIPPQAGPGDKALIDGLIDRQEGEIELHTAGDWVDQFDSYSAQLRVLRAELRQHESKLEEAKNNIKLQMGDATSAVLTDGRCVTLKEIIKKPYTVNPKPYWTFKIK